MTTIKEVKPVKIFMGKLTHNSDLIDEITNICIENKIRLGWLEALGAVRKARLGYYNQESREYKFSEINQPMEITNFIGNVSIKDGKPIVHAHVTLSDDKEKAHGGHLAHGTIVFACEIIIQVFEGPDFSRGHDDETGLPLWEMSD